MRLTVDGIDTPEVVIELTTRQAQSLADMLADVADGRGPRDLKYKVSSGGHMATLQFLVDDWAEHDPDRPPSG